VKILVSILTGAVSDMTVSSAFITKTIDNCRYFILVSPDHTKYWARFKEEHFNCEELAQEYGAKTEVACPEFPTREALLSWLADVLSLPKGVRNLLCFC